MPGSRHCCGEHDVAGWRTDLVTGTQPVYTHGDQAMTRPAGV